LQNRMTRSSWFTLQFFLLVTWYWGYSSTRHDLCILLALHRECMGETWSTPIP
jgi:hypothetical protein